MRRRDYLAGGGAALFVGITGCQGGTENGDELVGRGTLTLQNLSDGPVRARYGLFEVGESLDQEEMPRVELGVQGDEYEAIYTDVTGGPYRFVVVVADRANSPAEQQWDLTECREYGVTARIFPDAINISGSRCVRTE